jgi:hypothetical protein
MMENPNGGTSSAEAQELIATGGQGSLDGFGAAAPDDPLAQHPELVVGGALLAGLLLAALVSRLGR